MESVFDKDKKDEKPNFQVDSIELVAPKLFSDDSEIHSSNTSNTSNSQNDNEKNPEILESLNTEKNLEEKQTEMFWNLNIDEDFEIPAFLRKQKN